MLVHVGTKAVRAYRGRDRPGYDTAMPVPEGESVRPASEVDVAALFARLREEVRKGAVLDPSVPATASRTRVAARAEAERLWPITAERPMENRSGFRGIATRSVKKLVRKTVRWYVEPAIADQRAFNDALLKLVDDLEERVASLERRGSSSPEG